MAGFAYLYLSRLLMAFEELPSFTAPQSIRRTRSCFWKQRLLSRERFLIIKSCLAPKR